MPHRIDGCSEPMIWWRVIMPLSGPVVTVVALFQFQGSWNAFVWPLVMSSSERLYTISVGMYSLAYGSGSLTSMAELFQSVLLAGIGDGGAAHPDSLHRFSAQVRAGYRSHRPEVDRLICTLRCHPAKSNDQTRYSGARTGRG